MSSNKPKIRFKEFTDDWEQRKVFTIVKNIGTGKSKYILNKESSYAILGSRGVIGYDDTYDYMGNFILTARVGEYAGELYTFSGKAKITDNTVYLQCDNLDYMFYLLKKYNLKKLSFGSGQPLIKSSELSNLEILISRNDNEKKKIGEFFKQIDNLITLHQQKYNNLKNLKKSLLEKMFPKIDSDVPQIRFKGFTDAWEQRKLYELGNIVTGTTPNTNDSSNYGNDFLFVSPADIQENRYVVDTITKLSKKGFESGRILKERSILFVSIGSTIGKVAQTLEKVTTNQQINAIEVNEKFDSNYVYSLMKFNADSIKLNASTQAVPIINKTTFSELDINIIENLKEQEKIGILFEKLDNLITLHQKEVDKLQKIKKSLLNKMFV